MTNFSNTRSCETVMSLISFVQPDQLAPIQAVSVQAVTHTTQLSTSVKPLDVVNESTTVNQNESVNLQEIHVQLSLVTTTISVRQVNHVTVLIVITKLITVDSVQQVSSSIVLLIRTQHRQSQSQQPVRIYATQL